MPLAICRPVQQRCKLQQDRWGGKLSRGVFAAGDLTENSSVAAKSDVRSTRSPRSELETGFLLVDNECVKKIVLQ